MFKLIKMFKFIFLINKKYESKNWRLIIMGLVNLRVRRGRSGYVTDYTVVWKSSPVTSPAPPSETDEVVEVDHIPFLPSPLLLPSLYVIHDDSRTPSPAAASQKKEKKGKKKLKQ
jgi:hypothetical protein